MYTLSVVSLFEERKFQIFTSAIYLSCLLMPVQSAQYSLAPLQYLATFIVYIVFQLCSFTYFTMRIWFMHILPTRASNIRLPQSANFYKKGLKMVEFFKILKYGHSWIPHLLIGLYVHFSRLCLYFEPFIKTRRFCEKWLSCWNFQYIENKLSLMDLPSFNWLWCPF